MVRTISTIKSNSKGKVEYYTQDESLKTEGDYYSEQETHSQSKKLNTPTWYGKGAIALGLSGGVKKEDFERVFQGFKPDSDERLRYANLTGVERYGHDITLGMPKSASYSLHIGGDTRIFDAHVETVKETLDLVAKLYGGARQQVDGVRTVIPTDKIVASLIHHHTSRDGDMHTHTHALLHNTILRPDGEWVSLYHEDLSSANWLGSFYRNKLESKLNALGYETYKTKDGFEIAGISRPEIERFSKRTMRATEAVKTRGLEVNARNLKNAALATRKAKKIDKTLEELQEAWTLESTESAPQPGDRPVLPEIRRSEADLLNSAIAHYSDRLVKFRRDDLYQYVFDHGTHIDFGTLNQAIADHHDLVVVGENEFTTIQALEIQFKSLEVLDSGIERYNTLGRPSDLSETLNEGQKAAIEGTLNSSNSVVIWEGIAGAGKTYSLSELVKNTFLKIRGFAPTSEATENLGEALSIETETLQGHLLRNRPSEEPELWIVDEAGLIDAEMGHELLRKAQQDNARLLLVGDTAQNQSVKAGSFVRSLIDHGAETYHITKILRQQNDIQRRAVELISQKRGLDAFALLNEHDYIQEVDSSQERGEQIAAEYLALSKPERRKTLLIAGTNQDRMNIAIAVRQGLQDEGSLGEDHEIEILKNYSYTPEQARDINQIHIGDYIRLEQDFATTALERGKLYQVTGKDKHELLVQSSGGRHYRIDPRKYGKKTVYATQKINLAVGDVLRFRRSGSEKGLKNGSLLTVESIDSDAITVRTAKGELKELSLDLPLELEYGYTITSYRSQGKTVKRAFVSSTVDQTSSQEPVYVSWSRQKDANKAALKIWAEDTDFLRKQVQKSLAQENPYELLEDYYAPENRDRPKHSDRADHSSRSDRHPASDRSQEGERTAEQDRGTSARIPRRPQGVDPREAGALRATGTPSESRGLDQEGYPSERGITGPARNLDSQLHSAQSFSEASPNETIGNQIFEQRIDQAIAPAIEKLSSTDSSHKAVRQAKLEALASAINEWHSWQDIEFSNGIGQLADAVNLWQESRSLEQRQLINGLSDAINQWQQELNLDHSQTLDSLAEVTQQWQQSQEVDQYQEVQQLGEAIRQWQESQALEQGQSLEAIAEVTHQFQQEQSFDQAQMIGQLGELIQQWRQSQDISQQQTVEQLGEAIRQWQELQILDQGQSLNAIAHATQQWQQEQNLGYAEKVEALSSVIQAWQQSQSYDQQQLIDQLSEAIQSYRSQDLIEYVMEKFNQLEQAEDKTLSPNDKTDRAIAQAMVTQELSTAIPVVPSIPIERPQLIPVFWEPEYDDRDRPEFMCMHHWEEFKASAIHPELIKLNLESIQGIAVQMRLLEERLSKMGSGQQTTKPMAELLERYQSLADGGGWFGKAGIDPLDSWQLTTWGCFKGDNPRLDDDGEIIKYENPLGTQRKFYLANIPDWMAKKILAKHNVAFDPGDNFWKIVHEQNLPITFIEGYKKALSALSQGEIAIGVSGVNALYMANEKVNGKKFKLHERRLTEPAQFWATPGREIRWAMDKDPKLKAILSVQRDTVRAIELMPQCTHKVLDWDSKKGKGVDDLNAHNPRLFARAALRAGPADRLIKAHYRRLYNELHKKGLTDAQIWYGSCSRGDIYDGDRVLQQSDTARKNPEKAQEYIKQQKAIALDMMRRSQVSSQKTRKRGRGR